MGIKAQAKAINIALMTISIRVSLRLLFLSLYLSVFLSEAKKK